MAASIRSLRPQDREGWDPLWVGYLAFYGKDLAHEQTELTWTRLLDDAFGIHGLVAEVGGKLVGFAHFSFTHTTWAATQDIYLEDLYVDSSVRGQGIGSALILRLREIAGETGATKIWWDTQIHNETARRLYDSVGQVTDTVKYNLTLTD